MTIIILDSKYILQTTTSKTQSIGLDLFSSIANFLDIDPSKLTYSISTRFIAPYVNYHTTFSTTILQILKKLNNQAAPMIKRLEPIDTDIYKSYDQQIYKIYNTLEEYEYDLYNKADINLYTPIDTNSLQYKNLQLLGFDENGYFSKDNINIQLSYFDIMDWIYI
jgi:hypothetical protein